MGACSREPLVDLFPYEEPEEPQEEKEDVFANMNILGMFEETDNFAESMPEYKEGEVPPF